MFHQKNKRRGQTALEYMLVVGVVVAGAIFTAKFFFNGGADSKAAKLMDKTISEAAKPIGGLDSNNN